MNITPVEPNYSIKLTKKINISDANIKIFKEKDGISQFSAQQYLVRKAGSTYSEQEEFIGKNRICVSESKSNIGLPIIALNDTKLSNNPDNLGTDETFDVDKFDGGQTEDKLQEDLDDRVSIDEFYYSYNSQYKENIRLRAKNDVMIFQTDLPGSKVCKEYKSGRKETLFSNGARREVWPNGYKIVRYINGDIKQELTNGTVIYWYFNSDITEIDQKGGDKIVNIYGKRVEIYSKDGNRQTLYPDRDSLSFTVREVYFLFNDMGVLKYLDGIDVGDENNLLYKEKI